MAAPTTATARSLWTPKIAAPTRTGAPAAALCPVSVGAPRMRPRREPLGNRRLDSGTESVPCGTTSPPPHP
jgi:hypothetical protein